MTYSQNKYYFLLFCLGISFLLVYFIIEPFIIPLILAAVFAYLFQPIFKKFIHWTNGRESLASLASTIVALVIVIIPISFLGTMILKESTGLFQALTSGGGSEFIGIVENSVENLRGLLPLSSDFKLDIGQYTRQGLEALVQNLGSIFSSFAKILLKSFVFLTAFYFFLKDGSKLKNYFVALSPLSDNDDELIALRLSSAVSSAVKGNLTIGLIQGTLTGIGLALFGVPNPVLWGGVASITALVPGVGTALVIIPAVIFLYFTSSVLSASALLLWGVAAVGLVDNVLGPKLIGRGLHIHPLAVFLSVLGGLSVFGPMGFLLGPLAMSFCLALIDIYFSLQAKDSKIAQEKI